MPRCVDCEAFVSREYARVLGDNRGTVHGCPACSKPDGTPDRGVR